MDFRDLCASATCIFAFSTLKIRRVSSTACLRPKNSIFDQKTGHFGPFFHEKRHILVHTHALNGCFVICLPLQPVLLASSTLKIGAGSSAAYLKPKNSVFDQKTAIFGHLFMKNGKLWCIPML